MTEALTAILATATVRWTDSIWARVRLHLFAQLLCLGRHTITGLLTTQGRVRQDWSADYRLYSHARVDPEVLFQCVRTEVTRQVGANQPLVVAVDDSFLRKRGPRIHGVRWMRDPLGPPFHTNFVRGQRVLQFSAAVPTAPGQARLVPIDFVHAPMPKAPLDATPEEAAAYEAARRRHNINAVAVDRLTHLGAMMQRPLVVVGDGRFANRTFLRAVPPGHTVIARVRRDTKLHFAPDAQASTGRRRLYGQLAPTPEQLRQDPNVPWKKVRVFAAGKWHRFKVKVLPRVRTPMLGAAFCQVIVIAPLAYRLRVGARTLYRQPAYLLCTDPHMSVTAIVRDYTWRWDIEVNFRDEKTILGVGQAQVRTPESAARVPALAVASYGLLLAAATRANIQDPLVPPPRWQPRRAPRPSTSALLDRLRHECFARALRPESFTGFWSRTAPHHNGLKPTASLPHALFHHRN